MKKKIKKIITISKLHKLVWEETKRVYKKGNICYTCGKFCEGMGRHFGHGKPKVSLPLKFKYDVRNLKIQCMFCNKNLGGAADIFITKLEKEKKGLEFLKESCRNINGAWIIKKEDDKNFNSRLFLENLLEKLKKIP